MSIFSDAKDSGGVYVRPLFVQLAGDLVAGALLSQLAYWFTPDKHGKTKLKVKFDGVQWLAKSREELCTECCITLKQYKRAINVLVGKGYVETQLKMYAGKVTPHFRLHTDKMEWDWLQLKAEQEGAFENVTEQVMQAAKTAIVAEIQKSAVHAIEEICKEFGVPPYDPKAPLVLDQGKFIGSKFTPVDIVPEVLETVAPSPIGPLGPNPLDPFVPTHWTETSQSCLGLLGPIITETEIDQEQTTDTHTYASQPKPVMKPFAESLHPPQWDIGYTLKPWGADLDPAVHGTPKTVLWDPATNTFAYEADMKASDILAMKKQPEGGTAVIKWLQHMSVIYGFQKPLTKKQTGQLKQIVQHAGDKAIPLLEYVIPNWMTAVAYVKSKIKKGTSVPPQPDIGFILFYLNVFMQLIASDEPEEVEAPKPKVKYVTEMPEESSDDD